MKTPERIKIMRVIARLNMGGPALHVAYLTAGLRERGYDTTLVAGSLARGEDSMAFVADARDVQIVRIDELGREISPLRDFVATLRLARLIRRERPDILHTHTAKAGTIGRVAALLAGRRGPPIVVHTFHGHVRRRYLGIEPGHFAVGWIGRMTAVKRTDDVLVAFKRLREEGIDAVLCMVGDGPDRPELERRAHELGVVRHTLFLGYREDVAPFYAAFDALVLPSSNEGTPVSAIEALAAGRPVVATRVGGVPDVVQEGEDGFLVEPGATDELADRLARLAHDPELRERMGRAGRERVLPRYAVARLIDDVDRLYRSLLRAR